MIRSSPFRQPASSSSDESVLTWAGIWSALPDLILASQFLLFWVDPDILGAQLLPVFVGVMLAEFIVIHSSVVLGNTILKETDRRTKVRSVLGLGALYSLFFLGISVSFGQWYYLFGFWLLIGNRLLGVALGQVPAGQELALIRAGWGATTLSYLAGMFLTILLPLPRFGITEAIQDDYMISGSGLWIDEPHRAVAFGFLYFALVGWSEIHAHKWFSKVPLRPNGDRSSG